MARRSKKLTKKLTSFILGLIFLALASLGYFIYDKYFKVKKEVSGELSFHFMMLGNDKSGDSIYVKAGDNDILIDGGSDYDSIDDIKSYVDGYVSDNTLEYVIVTHADLDHIACFAGESGKSSLFDYYEVETIIDFPKSNKTTKAYERYQSERADEVADGNTVHYTALECYNEENGAKRFYDLTDDGSVKLEILYNYYYEHNTSNENDYSVCVMFHHGDRQFLFTGDLEEKGEEYLAEKYSFSQVELFKAGHHGSYTASNNVLLSEIKPKIYVVPCVAGSVQYSQNLANTFPAQSVIDRISKYTDRIYVPCYVDVIHNGEKYVNNGEAKMLNGNVVVISESGKDVYVNCSNNNTILKDTDWFKANRSFS